MHKTFHQVVVVLVIVIALLSGLKYGIEQHNQYIVFGVPIVLAVMMLIGKMEFLWCLLIMIFSSNLQAGNTTLVSVLALAFAGAGLLVVMMHKDDRTPMQLHHRYLVGLLFVSITMAMVRGIGLRALGSEMWGGAQYFTLWGGIGFCLFSNKMRVSEKNLIRAIIVMLVVGAFPGLLRYANEMLGGRLNGLGRFISGVAVAAIQRGGQATERLEGIQGSGSALITLAMALVFWRRATAFKLLALGFLGVAILGLAGYRGAMMGALLFLAFYYMLMRKEIPRTMKKTAIIVGLIALVLLPFLMPHLPFGFQRMFAWIPGINISDAAYDSAQGTTHWRIEMWKLILPMAKEYWLIGRGLAYELDMAYEAFIQRGDIEARHLFFISTHQYHNGPLYLLVDYGVSGFILATGFVITSLVRHWRLAKREWDNIFMRNLHAVFLARHTANVFMFYIIFGALGTMMTMFLDVLLMEMLIKVESTKGRIKTP